MDFDRPDKNLVGAIETACCRSTLFSDSTFDIFSSSLLKKRKQKKCYWLIVFHNVITKLNVPYSWVG